MASHRKAERGRDERLGLLLDGAARTPPPGAMDERAVRRVHESDDCVVYRGCESDAFDQIGRAHGSKSFEQWYLRSSRRLVAKEYPDVALYLAHFVAAGPDPVGREGLAGHERGDHGATAARIEPPAVIAALDLLPVEIAGA